MFDERSPITERSTLPGTAPPPRQKRSRSAGTAPNMASNTEPLKHAKKRRLQATSPLQPRPNQKLTASHTSSGKA